LKLSCEPTLGGRIGPANVNVSLRLILRQRRRRAPARRLGTPPAQYPGNEPPEAKAVPIRDSRAAAIANAGAGVMKHAASRELYAYWEERRGERPAPERADIEPGAIRQALSDTFILELDAGNGHSFRLAGTRVCALFGRELKGESFIDLWALGSRGPITDLLAISTDESVGTVAGVTSHNAMGETLDLELLLLPLGMRRPRLARTIGVLAPLKPPVWLGASPIGPLTLGSRRHVGAMTKTRLLPRFMAPRRGLVVHQGGRS
jgi:hypothetical protein